MIEREQSLEKRVSTWRPCGSRRARHLSSTHGRQTVPDTLCRTPAVARPTESEHSGNSERTCVRRSGEQCVSLNVRRRWWKTRGNSAVVDRPAWAVRGVVECAGECGRALASADVCWPSGNDARRQRFQRKRSSGETELVSSFSLSVVRLTVWLTSVYERGKGKRSGECLCTSVSVRSFPEDARHAWERQEVLSPQVNMGDLTLSFSLCCPLFLYVRLVIAMIIRVDVSRGRRAFGRVTGRRESGRCGSEDRAVRPLGQ
ncbi:hypothetical protein LR48_Vigan05g031800 [Vigna angularis]|uniref:Uncharacterized protein n=1 Tax=Phaseolus angularis TaxID=3914 RepID=A0A0L9UJH3_PHAAN|nr:hypothetical protein LR48_Vigan05g031800 [Vigna angularis]